MSTGSIVERWDMDAKKANEQGKILWFALITTIVVIHHVQISDRSCESLLTSVLAVAIHLATYPALDLSFGILLRWMARRSNPRLRVIRRRKDPVGMNAWFWNLFGLAIRVATVGLALLLIEALILGWLLVPEGFEFSTIRALATATTQSFTLRPEVPLSSCYIAFLELFGLCFFRIAPYSIYPKLLSDSYERAWRESSQMFSFRYLYWYIFVKSWILRSSVQVPIGAMLSLLLPLLIIRGRGLGMPFSFEGLYFSYLAFWCTGLFMLLIPLLQDYLNASSCFRDHALYNIARNIENPLENHVLIGPWSSTARNTLVRLYRSVVLDELCPEEIRGSPSLFQVVVDDRGDLKVIFTRFCIVDRSADLLTECYNESKRCGILNSGELIRIAPADCLKGNHSKMDPSDAQKSGESELEYCAPVYFLCYRGDLSEGSTLEILNYMDALLAINLSPDSTSAIDCLKAVSELGRIQRIRGFGHAGSRGAGALTGTPRPTPIPHSTVPQVPQQFQVQLPAPVIQAVTTSSQYSYLMPFTLTNSFFLVHPTLLHGISIGRAVFSQFLRLNPEVPRFLVLMGNLRIAYHAIDTLWTLQGQTQKGSHASSNWEWWIKKNVIVSTREPVEGCEDGNWNVSFQRAVSPEYSKQTSIRVLRNGLGDVDSIRFALDDLGALSGTTKSIALFVICSPDPWTNSQAAADLISSLDVLLPTLESLECHVLPVSLNPSIEYASMPRDSEGPFAFNRLRILPPIEFAELLENEIFSISRAILEAQMKPEYRFQGTGI